MPPPAANHSDSTAGRRLKSPAIHGHRGARGRRPENTLAAVEYALWCGVDGVEVDLCITADDAVVVHHDLRLNPDTTRDAGGRWVSERIAIFDLPLAELRRYDVGRLRPGSDTARRFAEQMPVDGARIPTLEEFVRLMARRGGIAVLNLELKRDPRYPELSPAPDRYAALVAGELERLHPQGPVFLQSFDWSLLAPLRREMARRGLPCKIGWTRGSPFGRAVLEQIAAAAGKDGDVLSCNYRHLNEMLMQQARDLGLEVYAWTVNREADMRRIAAWGVDAITTDYPERAREVFY